MFEIKDLSQADQVFPTTVAGFIPPYNEIPDEFKRHSNPWAKLQGQWFFRGIDGYSFIPKDGVDPEKALLHCKYVQGSWEPKHEHKSAGVAFLLHEWFDDVLDADGNSVIKDD